MEGDRAAVAAFGGLIRDGWEGTVIGAGAHVVDERSRGRAWWSCLERVAGGRGEAV
jgi:hypothetical protein